MDSVPGIIIAVLCLLILGGVVVLIWNALMNDEYQRAQTAINFIENKMNALKGNGESTSFNVQSPCKKADECDWFIFSFSKKEPVGRKPERCYFESCICICKKGNTGQMYDSNKRMLHENVYGKNGICQDLKTGICRKLDIEKVGVASIDASGSPVPYISLRAPLVEIVMKKDKDFAQIYYHSDSTNEKIELKYIENQQALI